MSVPTDAGILPAEIEALWRERILLRVDIHPLEPVYIKQLASSLVGGDLGPTSAARLAQICGGNPRLLEEVTRAAIEQGILENREGCWHLKEDAFPISSAILEVINPYFRNLNTSDREALEFISLAETPPLKVVEGIFGGSILEQLENKDLIRVSSRNRHGLRQSVVSISHPLISYTLSSQIQPLHRRRHLRTWTAAVGNGFEELGDGDYSRLAEWYVEAHETPPLAILQRAKEECVESLNLPSALRLSRAAWRYYPSLDSAQFHANALMACASFELLDDFIEEVRSRDEEFAYALREVEARSFLARGRYQQLDEAIRQLPESNQEFFRMVSNYSRGKFSAAYSIGAEIMSRKSGKHMFESGMIAMEALFRMGQPQRALTLYADLRKSCDEDDRGIRRWHEGSLEEMHASALHYLGKFDEAEQLYRHECAQVVEYYRGQIDATRGLALGRLLCDRGNMEAALKCFSSNSSYRVGWRKWQIEARIHSALAASCLSTSEYEGDLSSVQIEELTGHSSIFLVVLRARLMYEKGDILAAEQLLHDAIGRALESAANGDAVIAIHESARLSLRRPEYCFDSLSVEGSFLNFRIEYARAFYARDLKLMGKVARYFMEIGADLYAAEAYAELSRFCHQQGNIKAATASTVQARCLIKRCGEVDTPPLRFLGQSFLLSDRERIIAGLAAQGLSDKEVAARLSLSARTVSNTLYRVYRKIGATNRRELRTLMTGDAGTA